MLESYLFWNIIICISTTIEWLVFKFTLDNLSERKRSKKVIRILIALVIFTICFLTIEKVNPNTKLALGIIIGYLFYFLNYKTKKLKAIIVNLVYWMILIGLDFISLNFVLTINQTINIQELLRNDIFRLELIIISKFLLISIIPIIKSLKYNIEFKKREVLYITVLILANILSVVVIFTLSMNYMNKSFVQDLILLAVAVMLIL
ncbi:MAG: hypothetical protein RR942_13235 [Romboutsia sp.]